ncbi:HAMP domain-containing histidine kinase [Chitinophaga sedimenti]|uniref:sensor histidine kinase n=1 Tax=Chitinophaga sedimenti TaxID=2033606 RepID=UPI002005E29A|nr:HAMP domain-containing sensor histidine kinase [Chitinophaga sedimenti]MCK7553669.1 HAMP domain-containing histidine kinase [Chitinophaga sedimenti]
MKLFTKLTLFITLSKLAVVLLFVMLLPSLVDGVASRYNDYYLSQQKNKVLRVINKNGIDFYLQGEPDYGSYTMLKEEYISLEPAGKNILPDTIATLRRVVEEDTLTYRILTHVFSYNNKSYILEVGKTVSSIGQYNRPLQKMALYVLVGLIVITIVIDLVFTRLLLRPLGVIISNRLLHRKFPFKDHAPPIKTSTTDFKYLDASLVDLMDKIREAFEKEREFTSNASHELMTPVSILQTKMENMLVDGELSEEMEKQVLGMMKTLNRLKKIVNSLLFISRIENDQFPKADTFAVHTLLEEVMEELHHRLADKDLQYTVNVSRNAILRGQNHDLIFQLIYNLLNNAIRYNREGGAIIVSDSYKAGEPYRLSLRDTGIGIPEQEQTHIFNRFKKVEKSGNEGYGLGLSIVSTIARYHNIQLEVSSKVGEGSVFTLIFPEESLV